MTQIIEIKQLNDEQVETTLNNLCELRKLKKPEKIFEGKPTFDKETIETYKIPNITKFANNYKVYIAESKKDSCLDTNELFVLIFTDKFDKLHLSAIISLYYTLDFAKYVNVKSKIPHITIMPAYVVTQNMFTHVPKDIIPANYRFFSLASIYPLLGSKTMPYGFCFDYEIFEYEKTYNNKEYISINDSDPIIKAINGISGELLKCTRMLNDITPYYDVQIRLIISSKTEINVIDSSGICKNYDPKLQKDYLEKNNTK